jgi:hypothetical protein
MKRPRIALCLLMALFASSLYAVGFAADRDNLAGRYGAAAWAAEEADMCEYAYQGYCEYAYDRPADYLYDGCTAGDEDSAGTLDDEHCQAFAPDIDELETPSNGDEEIGLSDDENAGVESSAIDYELEYANELAEYPEPQAFDQDAWRRRYCLAREAEIADAEELPAGAIRDFVERVSDSLVRLLNDSSSSADAAWQLNAAGSSSGGLPPVARLAPPSSYQWSAANGALATGLNRWVVIDSLPLPPANLDLLIGPPKPVTLRDLVRPLARLAVGVRSHWQHAWSELGDLAVEGDEVPEVSNRPQAETASPSSDPGRDTRTSQRRNPRRVEI